MRVVALAPCANAVAGSVPIRVAWSAAASAIGAARRAQERDLFASMAGSVSTRRATAKRGPFEAFLVATAALLRLACRASEALRARPVRGPARAAAQTPHVLRDARARGSRHLAAVRAPSHSRS